MNPSASNYNTYISSQQQQGSNAAGYNYGGPGAPSYPPPQQQNPYAYMDQDVGAGGGAYYGGDGGYAAHPGGEMMDPAGGMMGGGAAYYGTGGPMDDWQQQQQIMTAQTTATPDGSYYPVQTLTVDSGGPLSAITYDPQLDALYCMTVACQQSWRSHRAAFLSTHSVSDGQLHARVASHPQAPASVLNAVYGCLYASDSSLGAPPPGSRSG